jgi:glycyl-tRNA synthetase
MTSDAPLMEKITALCKRRGFIFQSSEIYGGIAGFWDYGPLGVELKRNIKNAWWEDMVTNRADVVGIETSIIMNPKVWEASGHVGGFSDPMRDCKKCKSRFRSDWLVRNAFIEVDSVPERIDDMWKIYDVIEGKTPVAVFCQEQGREIDDHKEGAKGALGAKRFKWILVPRADGAIRNQNEVFCKADGRFYFLWQSPEGHSDQIEMCPNCGGELTEARAFNLMFESHTGALQDSTSKVYLRPETAQGIFVNFKNVVDSTRIKVPFGIAQIGKSFRNEINPRNYTFRSREFEQMEIEFFCHPDEADQWYTYWRDLRHQWYINLGLKSDNLQLRNHEADELAHYARGCSDVEYLFPFADTHQELEGIANRTDYDLNAHAKASGKDLTYFDDQRKERFIPYVIEPSAGADRTTLAVLCEAYTVDESRPSPELMCFHPRIAPIKAAVFPLVAKEGMPEVAEAIFNDISKHHPAQFDVKQSIGKRYARMDEAGTPFCFTVDGQTKEDGTVTVRDRDTGQQERIDKSRCVAYLGDRLRETP